MLLLRVLTSLQTYGGWLDPLVPAFPYFGKYCFPIALMAETGTIYLTVLVTLNRYFSVCRPYEVSNLCSKRTARQHIAIVVAFSIIYNVPRFFEYTIVEQPSLGAGILDSSTANQTTPSDGDDAFASLPPPQVHVISVLSPMAAHFAYQVIYMNISYCIVMFLIPLCSLIFLNYRLIAKLRETTRKRRQLLNSKGGGSCGGGDYGSGNGGSGRHLTATKPSGKEGAGGNGGGGRTSPRRHQTRQYQSRSEDDVTLTLIVVVLTFVVCQTPALVTQVLQTFLGGEEKNCGRAFFFYERLSDFMVVANSAINFIIYCFCSRRFRRILLALFCGGRQGYAMPETSGYSHTVNNVRLALNESRSPSFLINSSKSPNISRSPSCLSSRSPEPSQTATFPASLKLPFQLSSSVSCSSLKQHQQAVVATTANALPSPPHSCSSPKSVYLELPVTNSCLSQKEVSV